MRPLLSNESLPRVLYIEDEEDNFLTAQLQLRKRFRLTWACSDEKALELLRAEPEAYSAILMDLELRGGRMDGRDLSRLISGKAALTADRAPLTPSDVPIIFLTAYGQRYSEVELLESGANAVMVKPVDFRRLRTTLDTVSHKTPIPSR